MNLASPASAYSEESDPGHVPAVSEEDAAAAAEAEAAEERAAIELCARAEAAGREASLAALHNKEQEVFGLPPEVLDIVFDNIADARCVPAGRGHD